MRILSFSILFVLSAKNFFMASGFLSYNRPLWLVLFIYLATSLSLQWVKIRPPTDSMEAQGIALSLLLVNFVVQQTGGLHSPLLPFYVLLILFSSFYFSLFKNMLAVTAILFLEGSHFYFSPVLGEIPQEAVFFPFLLILIPVMIKSYLRSFHREREALWGRFDRIKSSVDSLEPPSEVYQKIELARLSEEEKQDEALRLSERMEAHLENMLQVILASRSQINRSVILFYDRPEECLWIRASKGREAQIGTHRDKLIRIGGGLLGWIAKEKRVISIADLRHQRGKVDYDDGSVPIGSLLAVPLFDRDVFEGLLCVDSSEDHAFSDEDEQLIQLVAQEVVTLLKYYREQQGMSRQARVYSALLEISKNLGSKLDLNHRLETTLVSAKEMIDYDACFIFLVEPGERRMTVKAVKGYDPTIIDYAFPVTNGLLSLIVKNRQVLLFSKLFREQTQKKIFPHGCKIQPSASSFLGLPMIIEDRVIGVVLFLSDKESAFTTYNRHVLSIMCNHVAASIAEAQAHAQVERLAITDGLTGLLNHRRFQERLLEEFTRVYRHPEMFSLLLIDIDYFKKINDTHGHPAGDAVIKMVAKILAKWVRKIDTVARYGGEEFVILLLKTDAKEALHLAERIRKAVEAAPLEWQGKRIHATISIGIASQPEDAIKKEDLIAYADRALYASKQAGRNCTTLYKDLTQDMYEVG